MFNTEQTCLHFAYDLMSMNFMKRFGFSRTAVTFHRHCSFEISFRKSFQFIYSVWFTMINLICRRLISGRKICRYEWFGSALIKAKSCEKLEQRTKRTQVCSMLRNRSKSENNQSWDLYEIIVLIDMEPMTRLQCGNRYQATTFATAFNKGP